MKIKVAVLSILLTGTAMAQTLYVPKDDKKSSTTMDKNRQSSEYRKSNENTPVFTKKNSIKVGLISPFIETLSLAYNRYLNDESAFQIGFSHTNDLTLNSNKYNINAQTFTLEYRYILSGTHALGTYIQPFSRTINYHSTVAATTTWDYYSGKNITTSSYTESCISTGLGFLVGFQSAFKNKILIDMFVGPVYSFQLERKTGAPAGTYPSSFSDRGTLDDHILKNYGVRAGLNLGFLF